MNSPLLRLTIPMIAGMCGALLYPHRIEATLPFAGACICTALMLIVMRLKRQPLLFSILSTLAAACIGATLLTRQHNRIADGVPADTAHVRGILTEWPQTKARTTALRLRQGNGTHIILYARAFDADVHLGDTILAHTAYLTPTAASSDNDEYASYRRHLFSQGVCATAYVPEGRWSCRPCRDGMSIAEKLRAMQDRLHLIYEDNGIEGDEGSVIEAMTIGRRTSLDKSTRQHYAQSGVSHVLALSGFHVGIILIVLQWLLLTPVVGIRWRWASNLLIIASLWCYVIIAGSSASLVRAALMCTILLLCKSFTRQALSLNNVVLSLTAMLCFNPLYISDAGFQLSFAAVLGIALLGSKTQHALHIHNAPARFAWSIIAITAICFIATAPLAAYHFGYLPVYGMLTNLLIYTLVSLLLMLSVAWWLTIGICHAAATALGTAMVALSHTINATTEWVATLPCATLPWHPSALGVLLCYILYALVWCAAYNMRKIG